MMKLTTIVALIPLASAFTTCGPTARLSTTAVYSIDTRHRLADQEIGVWTQHCVDDAGNYAPCDAVSGHERRASWESYAPMTSDGNTVRYTGAIGCPGGGDWCYATSYGGASKVDNEIIKNAATVAAALAGLGSGVGGAKSDIGLSIPKGAGSGQITAVRYSGSIGFTTASVSGHDVRGARGSYAKPTNYHFVSGEIGLSQGGAAVAKSASRVPANKRKSYGIGSWKK